MNFRESISNSDEKTMSFRKYNNETRPEEESSRISIISQQINSPDPVEMVRQYEQDENLARLLQAEFNHEMTDVSRSSISIGSPNVAFEPSTSGRSVPQFDNLSEDDVALHGELVDQNGSGFVNEPEAEEERYTEEGLGDDEVDDDSDCDEDDIEVDEEDIEVDEEDEVDEVDEVDEDDDVDDEEDGINEEDEDLDETVDVDDVDRSRLFPEEIDRLPTHINAAPSSSMGGEECATKMCQVCQESYAMGDELRVLPCFHKFHSSCIDPWLLSSTTCPVCRAKVDLREEVGC